VPGLSSFSDRYLLGVTIGQGAFGEVFATTKLGDAISLANYASSGAGAAAATERLATKVQAVSSPGDDQQLASEIDIWRSVGSHENCVRLIEIFFDGQTAHLVMERCDSSLKQFLTAVPLGEEAQVSRLARGMLRGLAHLHGNCKAVHCDVKPDNFLIGTDRVTVKLADYGLAQVLAPGENLHIKAIGTVVCMSPEMLLRGNGFGHKTDLWSLGVTLYFLLYGTWPYAPFHTSKEVTKAVIRANDPPPTFSKSPHCPTSGVNPDGAVESFVRALLTHAALERPTASQALKLPFVYQVASDEEEAKLDDAFSFSSARCVGNRDVLGKAIYAVKVVNGSESHTLSGVSTAADSCAMRLSGSANASSSQFSDVSHPPQRAVPFLLPTCLRDC